MKNSLFARISALLLAGLMLLSVVACAATNEDETAKSSDTLASSEASDETEYKPDIERQNYDKDFNIVIGGTISAEHILLDEEDNTGDPLDNSVYERAVNIQDHLGVTCVLQDAGSWTEYSGAVIRTVSAGDDDYQLVYTPVYQGVCDLITAGVLYDFADLDSVNLDAPYWNRSLMEEIMIEDQYLLGYNDTCLSLVNCIVFNKSMQESYQLELPYELVRNKKWTLDKLIGMASAVHEDNGDGVRGAEDTYGITGWGWVHLISLITSSDLKIVDRNPETDEYEIAYEHNTEKLLDLIDTVYDLYNAEYAYF